MSASEMYTLDKAPWVCPTLSWIEEQVDERIEKARGMHPDDWRSAFGVWQFGVMDLPREAQIENAKSFWSSLIGNCCCCGTTVHDMDEQPDCGHLYCYICLGRGHEEDCANGLCEGLS